MQPAVLVRLRPIGPWRSGPGLSPEGTHRNGGGSQGVDALFRSDRLFSALTLAFADLGYLDEWLNDTARAEKPAVRPGSLFPFQAETLFAAPPRTVWPPPSHLVTSPRPVFLSRLRWANARFVPATLVQSLVAGQPILADQWMVDAESGCLLRRDRPSSSPFRHTVRSRAAVDRIHGSSPDADAIACVEFEPAAGLWTVLTFADHEAEQTWRVRIEGAFRLLADTGFGGGRRIGWGQVGLPQFEYGAWPDLLLPKLASSEAEGGHDLYWLLSLYSPAAADRIDWKAGDYRTTSRCGHVLSGELKMVLRLIDEGSVIASASDPVGRAVDVAPEGFGHPIYRAGFGLTVRLPKLMAQTEPTQIETGRVEAAAEPPIIGSDLTDEASDLAPSQPPEAAPDPLVEVDPHDSEAAAETPADSTVPETTESNES